MVPVALNAQVKEIHAYAQCGYQSFFFCTEWGDGVIAFQEAVCFDLAFGHVADKAVQLQDIVSYIETLPAIAAEIEVEQGRYQTGSDGNRRRLPHRIVTAGTAPGATRKDESWIRGNDS